MALAAQTATAGAECRCRLVRGKSRHRHRLLHQGQAHAVSDVPEYAFVESRRRRVSDGEAEFHPPHDHGQAGGSAFCFLRTRHAAPEPPMSPGLPSRSSRPRSVPARASPPRSTTTCWRSPGRRPIAARRQPAAEGRQCGGDKRFAFIVHGLWPQYRAGWPEFCFTPEVSVPEDTIAAMLPVMPSSRLIVHQWRKHGSCSGLTMDGYFALMKSLFAKVRIPARYLSPTAAIVTTPRDIVSDFVKSNRGLDPSMISLRCGSRKPQARLSEVRICFGLDGRFILLRRERACADAGRRACFCRRLVRPTPPARTERARP